MLKLISKLLLDYLNAGLAIGVDLTLHFNLVFIDTLFAYFLNSIILLNEVLYSNFIVDFPSRVHAWTWLHLLVHFKLGSKLDWNLDAIIIPLFYIFYLSSSTRNVLECLLLLCQFDLLLALVIKIFILVVDHLINRLVRLVTTNFVLVLSTMRAFVLFVDYFELVNLILFDLHSQLLDPLLFCLLLLLFFIGLIFWILEFFAVLFCKRGE